MRGSREDSSIERGIGRLLLSPSTARNGHHGWGSTTWLGSGKTRGSLVPLTDLSLATDPLDG